MIIYIATNFSYNVLIELFKILSHWKKI